MIPIDDISDRRLEPYRRLKQQGREARLGLFITEGDKLTRRLLQSGLSVHSVLVDRTHAEAFAERVPASVPLYVVADDAIEQIIGFNFHRGILGCGIRPPQPTVEKLMQRLDGNGPRSPLTLLVCAGVVDPENLGSMLRTAGALGLDGAILSHDCADLLSRRVLRVSMGTVFRLPWAITSDLAGTLRQLQADYSVESWATVLDPPADGLHDVVRPSRLAIVFGSEGHGIEPAVAEACRRRVTIPMQPGIDSLNVSVAAGIVLYHLMRS